MAITDNTFTADEFKAAVAANPQLIKDIVAPELTSQKYVVHDEVAHTNYLKNQEERIAKDITKRNAESLEKDVLEITGIQKNEDEKYYDYLKRALGQRISDHDNIKSELDELKKGTKPNEVDKQRITELEKALAEKKTEIDTLKANHLKEVNTQKITSEGQNALTEVGKVFKADLDKTLLGLATKTAITELSEMAEVTDDNAIIFKDKDGNVIMNTESHLPMTWAEMLNKHEAIKPLVDPNAVKTGTGSKPKQPTPADGKDGKDGKPNPITSLPADVKTKVDLTAYLQKNGHVQGSEEYTKAFAEFGENLPLR